MKRGVCWHERSERDWGALGGALSGLWMMLATQFPGRCPGLENHCAFGAQTGGRRADLNIAHEVFSPEGAPLVSPGQRPGISTHWDHLRAEGAQAGYRTGKRVGVQ